MTARPDLPFLGGGSAGILTFPAEILGHIFISCRDNSLEEPEYWIADPKHAPMVLSQVSSRWRTVSHGTPRLWNIIRLPRFAFEGKTVDLVPGIFGRSGNVPLSVTLQSPPLMRHIEGHWYEEPELELPGRWLDIVWNAHRRLESVRLEIDLHNVTPLVFPRHTIFPMLSSVQIMVWGDHAPDYALIFKSFEQAPFLRAFDLCAHNVDVFIISTTFPWGQLTTLKLNLPITTDIARDILALCPALEIAKLKDVFNVPDDDATPPPLPFIGTLSHLRELDISGNWDRVACELLALVTLPALESLVLSAPEPLTSVFLALHMRSQFSLVHLSIGQFELRAEQLLSLLRMLPMLQTLDINRCSCITNQLFDLLTPKTDAESAVDPDTLKLPHLSTLKIHPLSRKHSGAVVMRMVEALAAHTSDTFPQLKKLYLYRERFPTGPWSAGPPVFSADVEARLAVVRSTGFLVDKYPRGWTE
ncbi:hypothetical protein C8R43DRAFT_976092 [Mycena crocata]|nr:hypothetical protein C8R43DRAFT_976092 [Mycena crocata]